MIAQNGGYLALRGEFQYHLQPSALPPGTVGYAFSNSMEMEDKAEKETALKTSSKDPVIVKNRITFSEPLGNWDLKSHVDNITRSFMLFLRS